MPLLHAPCTSSLLSKNTTISPLSLSVLWMSIVASRAKVDPTLEPVAGQSLTQNPNTILPKT